jgi:DNA-binding transcriptional MerR regulator
VRITRADGLVDAQQAAQLCGVQVGTIRQWVARGHLAKAGLDDKGRSLFDPVALQRAEFHTRKRARRVVVRQPAA